jgi:hypothetical protein
MMAIQQRLSYQRATLKIEDNIQDQSSRKQTSCTVIGSDDETLLENGDYQLVDA